MPIDPQAAIEISAYNWVPDIARGLVRHLRPRWALEEIHIGDKPREQNMRKRAITWLIAALNSIEPFIGELRLGPARLSFGA